MARSLIGGLLSNEFDRSSIMVSDPVAQARQYLSDHFRVSATADNSEVIANCASVILAVKPQVMRQALEDARQALRQRRPLLISIAAGITTDSIAEWSGGDYAIIRVMPNTPALIQKGISALYANERVSPEQKQYTESILSAVGKTVWVSEESQLDAVTAVSGSGPAYFFYLIEAVQAGAENLGLQPEDAKLLAIETAMGSALLAGQGDDSPATLRRKVTSPGGTTEAALNVLESAQVKDRFIQAIEAARNRAAEMSKHVV